LVEVDLRLWDYHTIHGEEWSAAGCCGATSDEMTNVTRCITPEMRARCREDNATAFATRKLPAQSKPPATKGTQRSKRYTQGKSAL